MLRPFHLFNMNVYMLNQPYGMVIMLVGVIGILCTVLNQTKVSRIAAFASLILVVLLYIAALLKVKASFSFIPFKGVEGFFTRQIAFKWGWYVLFAGPVLSVLGVLASKKRVYSEGQ
ncbi:MULTISPECIES: hypothetical protein [unclassified Mucilaginibacter]|uniref:hypothetical protein n=1 Tax=unclassified Mucilaginibacter TaxID=2617802 RepID=UPI002AC9DCF7|nr:MULTISPECIES: hypothetical protein [unclassified Mucilaginibacter]MEB0263152.1 hypothetical protein [Mucilaginibacter sp. 10I4]MEB0280278.1 hypothetical protein [Mucilaginibacter sp. 10B2]MEB0300223.1 hypothetical protein [Mucilaginibacter sp. 5C4]WPX25581.1 hypothetical protein RHM67_09910 [Mucilaginibacter sp. 5C4]